MPASAGDGEAGMRILGGFFLFLGFELRSGLHHFSAFIGAALRANTMGKHAGMALGTFLGLRQGDVVLLARAIAAMTGVPLLG